MLRLKAQHNMLAPGVAETLQANKRWMSLRETSTMSAVDAREVWCQATGESPPHKKPRIDRDTVEHQVHLLRGTAQEAR